MDTLHLSEVIVKYTTDKFYFNTDNKYKTYLLNSKQIRIQVWITWHG